MFWNQREERFQQSDDKVDGLDSWSSSKKEVKTPLYLPIVHLYLPSVQSCFLLRLAPKLRVEQLAVAEENCHANCTSFLEKSCNSSKPRDLS